MKKATLVDANELIKKLADNCDNKIELKAAIKGLKTRFINTCLDSELDHHLAYEKHSRSEGIVSEKNYRNGHTAKRLY
ncbi:MAG: hypothetical protein COB50_03635, partial [Thiotrichales bacterium]